MGKEDVEEIEKPFVLVVVGFFFHNDSIFMRGG